MSRPQSQFSPAKAVKRERRNAGQPSPANQIMQSRLTTVKNNPLPRKEPGVGKAWHSCPKRQPSSLRRGQERTSLEERRERSRGAEGQRSRGQSSRRESKATVPQGSGSRSQSFTSTTLQPALMTISLHHRGSVLFDLPYSNSTANPPPQWRAIYLHILRMLQPIADFAAHR